MRTPSFRIAWLLVCLPVAMATLADDKGGGSGKLLSPYKTDSAISVRQISKLRDAANRIRIVETNVPDAPRRLWRVSLAYSTGSNQPGKPAYSLEGRDANGKNRKIPFSDLEQIKVIGQEPAEFMTVEADVFPTITPAELESTRPTYKELKMRRATQTITIRILKGKADLNLTGRRREVPDSDLALVPLKSLPAGSVIKFVHPRDLRTGDDLWWAIPSVIRDREYPYRAATMVE